MEIASGVLKLLGTLALTTIFNKFLSTFRIRQLYLSFENVLPCHDPDVKGYTASLAIYNKGKDKEKNVEIIIPKSKKCQILASDYPSITCVDNVVSIDRIIPKQKVNISVFIEGEDKISKKNKPLIKSEDASGKAYASRYEVPASMGPSVLSASIVFAVMALMFYSVWAGEGPFKMYYAIKYSEFVDQGLIPSGAGDNYMISKGSADARLIEVLPITMSRDKLVFSYRIKNPTIKPIYVSVLSSPGMDYYRELSSVKRSDPKEVSDKRKAEIDLRYWRAGEYDPESSVSDEVILPGQEKILAVKKAKVVGVDPNNLELSITIEGETDSGDVFKDLYNVVPAKSKTSKVFLELLR